MYEQIAFFSEYLATAGNRTFKEVLTRMRRLYMKVKSRCPGKCFLAGRICACKFIGVLMASFMVFQMLFELKGFKAAFVCAFEYSVWELYGKH